MKISIREDGVYRLVSIKESLNTGRWSLQSSLNKGKSQYEKVEFTN